MSEKLRGHLSHQEIADYRTRTMSPAELIAADDHLFMCEACSQQVSDADRWEEKTLILSGDSITNRETASHLRYEQLAAYVDNELDEVEREICDVHLQVCQACSEELRDLRAFKAQLQPSLNDERAPVRSAKTLQNRFGHPRLQWSRLQFAGASVLCALLVAGLAWSIWRLSRSSPQEVTKTTVPPITESPAPSATQPVLAASPSASQIVVTLNDAGKTITLDEKGNVQGLEEVSQSYRQAISLALRTGQLNIPAESLELSGNAGVLMGGHSDGVAFALVHPVGILIQTSRPTFRWRKLEGASSYVVKVFDASFNKVVASPQLSEMQWTVPSALPTGKIYFWQVTAMKDDKEINSPIPPAPPAKFKILEQEKAAELERIRRAHPTSHLTLGTVYAQAGLLEDAEREFRALLAANPQAPIAQKLLRDVRR